MDASRCFWRVKGVALPRLVLRRRAVRGRRTSLEAEWCNWAFWRRDSSLPDECLTAESSAVWPLGRSKERFRRKMPWRCRILRFWGTRTGRDGSAMVGTWAAAWTEASGQTIVLSTGNVVSATLEQHACCCSELASAITWVLLGGHSSLQALKPQGVDQLEWCQVQSGIINQLERSIKKQSAFFSYSNHGCNPVNEGILNKKEKATRPKKSISSP